VVGKIACAHERDAFELSPLGNMGYIHVLTGGTRIFGMNVKISDKFHRP
jgi:hypothetical protein